jgi:hypothetical protein
MKKAKKKNNKLIEKKKLAEKLQICDHNISSLLHVQ